MQRIWIWTLEKKRAAASPSRRYLTSENSYYTMYYIVTWLTQAST